jgi:hypothetical protein
MSGPPCKSCPFRVDQHAPDIPCFSLELAEGLVNTLSDKFGAPIMACHQSKDGTDTPCRGWLVRHGWDSIAIRLRMLRGMTAPDELEIGDNWPELHADYHEVLDKLRSDSWTT